NAARAGDARDGDTFGSTDVFASEFGSTARARRLSLAIVSGDWRFLAALRADIDVFAERDFNSFENVFLVEAEALAVRDIANVRTEFAVGPQEIPDGCERVLDVIVLLDELRDIAGRASRGDVRKRLCGLRVKANARHILREHRHERQAKSLIKIR